MSVSNWPATPAVDHLALNRFERDVKVLAGEIHDCGFDDLPELLLKLDGVVGLCSELRSLAVRHEDAIARARGREEMETAIPPLSA
jgi:hypothetical protein